MVKPMPDQSSAAREHALIQEITAPLATLPDDPVSVTADVHFPIALRGYDRIAVDAYVKQTSQLVAELQATRSPEAAIRRALDRVGEQIAGILQRAHDTAEQITTQSRSEAEDRLEAARQEAAKITAAAQQRLKDLDADTDRIWSERRQIVDDTRELANQLLGLTDSAADRFPAAEDTGSTDEVHATPGEHEEIAAAEHGDLERPVDEPTEAPYGDEPRQPYDDDPRQPYDEDPPQRHIDDPRQPYDEDPPQRYTEDPPQRYIEDPPQRYIEDPPQRYIEDPPQRYTEDPPQRYPEDPQPPDAEEAGVPPVGAPDETMPTITMGGPAAPEPSEDETAVLPPVRPAEDTEQQS
jgi:vacuolar-type H+-ATPase subunit H